MAKEVRALVRRLERRGWAVDRGRRHVRLYPPDGGDFIMCGTTPSNGRWRQNVEASIKRAGYAQHLKGGRS